MSRNSQRDKIEELVKRKSDSPTSGKGVGFSPHVHHKAQVEGAPEGSWKIEATDGVGAGSSVDKLRKVATVPLGGSRLEEVVRLHEAEHLTATDLPRLKKWLSRRKAARLTDKQLRMLEEIRVNGRLVGKGFVTAQELQGVSEADGEAIPTWDQINTAFTKARTPDQIEDAAMAALCRVRLGQSCVGPSDPLLNSLVSKASLAFSRPDNPNVVSKLARTLVNIGKDWQQQKQAQQTQQSVLDGLGVNGDSDLGKWIERLAQRHPQQGVQAINRAKQKVGEWHGRKPEMQQGRQSDGWGHVELVEPPRTHRVCKKADGSNWVITDQPSSKVVRPERLMRWGDQLGFKRKKRHRGTGSFLLDGSSSMNWTASTIREVVKAMPRANIAMYSGGSWGYLVIVAMKGYRISDKGLDVAIDGYMGARNSIDGPALKWLAKQPEPRVWISDGHVNGAYGTSLYLAAECSEICKRAKIARVEDHEIVESLGLDPLPK
jgi:hypothetical protein